MGDEFNQMPQQPNPNQMVVPQNHPQMQPPQRMLAPHLNPVQQMPMQPPSNQQIRSNIPVQVRMPTNQMPMQNTGHLMPPPNMPPPIQRAPMYSPQQQYMNAGPPPNMPNMGPPQQNPNMMNRNMPPHQLNQQSPIQSPISNANRGPIQSMQSPMAPPQSPIANSYAPIPNQPPQMSRPIVNAPPSIAQQLPAGSSNSPQISNPNQPPASPVQQQSLKRPLSVQQSMQSPMTPSTNKPQMSATPTPSNQPQQQAVSVSKTNKKKKLADKILPQKVRDIVPESQAYMDLLAFERKLDFTITRKRLEIQESIKRPMKQKRKLRMFVTNTFFPGRLAIEPGMENDATLGVSAGSGELASVPCWELKIEGRLLDDQTASKPEQNKMKPKFSSFLKSLVIELDKDIYGPDNQLVEWHRTPNTAETDGFQVKRPGDKNVKCQILLLLDHSPPQFKLDPRLARLLGIHNQTRAVIINALWQYIKTHKLQDAHEREFINCDKCLEQIFQCTRMRFGEIPARLSPLLSPVDPIEINHLISVDPGCEMSYRKQSMYDIDVEIDDPLKMQMSNFVMSTSSQQEIQNLDNRIHETVDTINELKTNREFLLGFANDPQKFIQKWLISQMRDLKVITDTVGNPEEERKSDFFYQAWTQEAVCRYFYGKVQQKRAELEQALGIRNS